MYRAGQELKLLDPPQLTLFKEAHKTEGLCAVVQEGEERTTYTDVSVHQMFPLSNPDSLITLCDKFGNEIGTLVDPGNLDAASQEALSQELGLAYFIPKITRISSIRDEYGLVRWEVETDKGSRTFEVQSRHDIRPMGGGRFIIRDMDGNRYDIPAMHALDGASRAILEMEV